MSEPISLCLLEDLGALRIRGADAQKFLQGQLSNDMQHLNAQTLLRAGLHNPQGRTLALLGLVLTAADDVLALLPRELIATVAANLKRYVLRSKVTISDDSDQWRIYGLTGPHTSAPAATQRCNYGLGTDSRQLLWQHAADAALPSTLSREQWRALDIAAGLPQVASVNSGQFVAQMLNLDCIDAISFNKGCYTGQEIIARAHFRGRVKRRMQRFVTSSAQSLETGNVGRLTDGRHFRVVEATMREDGRCEFLAVAHVPGASHEGDGVGAAGEPPLAASALPLPYQLPA